MVKITNPALTSDDVPKEGQKQPVWVKEEGFTILYEPQNATPLADIVFVHRLQGYPRRTWTYKGILKMMAPATKSKSFILRRFFKSKELETSSPSLQKKRKSVSIFWPADLLPQD